MWDLNLGKLCYLVPVNRPPYPTSLNTHCEDPSMAYSSAIPRQLAPTVGQGTARSTQAIPRQLAPIITVSGSFTKARDYEINEAAVAEAVLYSEEFKEIQSKVDDSEMPASKKQISDSTPAFKAAIETKPVELVVGYASKVTTIGTNLDRK